MTQSRLSGVACDLASANAFVRRFHRHHEPIQTHKFSLAVVDESNTVRGVAICNRPASRMLDDGWTLEVARVATDGCDNACSALYGAAWRTAKAMGYRRAISYILTSEPGISLRGAGWRLTKTGAGGGHLVASVPTTRGQAPARAEAAVGSRYPAALSACAAMADR